MGLKIFNKFSKAREWVKAARLYRDTKYNEFLSAVQKLEESNTLSLYQLAMKANALLMVDRYRESLALFSLISSDYDHAPPDAEYIQLYAQAMICDINGDSAGFNRIADRASTVKCSYLVKRNLPLTQS
jgi:hypothetical protein